MGDRAQQIVSEWFVKCANVVIQSRLAAGATERAPRERQNRWFNLDVDEHEAHVSALQPWRRARDPPPLVLEISLRPSSETDSAPRPAALVERWTFRRVIPGDASPTSHASPGTSPGHPGTTRPVPRDGTDAPAAYKRAAVTVRAVHATLRALPAHRYAREVSTRARENRPAGYSVVCEVRAAPELSDKLSDKDKVSDGVFDGFDAPNGSVRTVSFAPTTAPGPAGAVLEASVRFIDDDALRGLGLADAPAAFTPRIIADYLSDPSPPGSGAGAGSGFASGFASGFGSGFGRGRSPSPGTSPSQSQRRAHGWAGRATYFGAGGDGDGQNGNGDGHDGNGGNVSVSVSVSETPPPPSRVGIHRPGSRGLLSEEIAEHARGATTNDTADRASRPPLSPAPPESAGAGIGIRTGVSCVANDASSSPSSAARLASRAANLALPAPIIGFDADASNAYASSSPSSVPLGASPSLPFASSLSASRGSHRSSSLASPAHHLALMDRARRQSQRRGSGVGIGSNHHGVGSNPGFGSGSGASTPGGPGTPGATTPRGPSSFPASIPSASPFPFPGESPPWNFKGLSPSPGSTPRDSRGGSTRRASWTSPASSLSASLHESSPSAAGSARARGGGGGSGCGGGGGGGSGGGGAVVGAVGVGGPFAYGASLGTSPGGTGAAFLAARFGESPGCSRFGESPGCSRAPRDFDPRGGGDSLALGDSSDVFALDVDPLPFALDDDDVFAPSPPRREPSRPEARPGDGGDDDDDDRYAAAGALLRLLSDATGAEGGADGGAEGGAVTLDWATARLAEFRAFEASMEGDENARDEARAAAPAADAAGESRSGREEETAERAEEMKETEDRAPSASVVIDAAVDEAVEWAIPSEDAAP